MTDRDGNPKDHDEADGPVDTWERRAMGFAGLVRRHDIFERLADGLLARTEGRVDTQSVFDVGAGTGVVSERWLTRGGRPAGLIASEPSAALRRVLVERLAAHGVPSSAVLPARVEDLDEHFGAPPLRACVDAALASAVLHLVDLERALTALARVVRPGGVLAFNLWWHRVSEDAARHSPDAHWRPALARALAEEDEAPTLARPTRLAKHAAIGVQHVVELARASGWQCDDFERYETEVDGAFFVDFAAMDPDFLDAVEPVRRERVLARARELAPRCTIGWREVVLMREESAP